MAVEWQRVEELYWTALSVEPEQRPELLDQLCAGDSDLRCELQSLLEADAQAVAFLESSALATAARLLPADGMGSLAGSSLGRYRVLSLAGAGMMGAVYRAHDLKLNRTVAIKTLPSWLAFDTQMRQRMRNEALAIARLSHPNICRLHDIDSAAGVHFLVMEFVEGVTLAERLARGTLPIEEALQCAIEVAGALHAAHEKGIIHRDLKPGNIMLTPTGAVLTDFGLAKNVFALAVTPTLEGAVVGTAAYMSPEQARGEELDVRTDIFSFGLVLFELMTGRRALSGDTVPAVFAELMSDRPVASKEALTGLPEALRAIIDKSVAKPRDARFQSAAQLQHELKVVQHALEQPRPKAPAVPWAPSRRAMQMAAGVVLVAAAATSLFGLFTSRRESPQTPRHKVYSLTANPSGVPVLGSAISPDGKYVAWSDTQGIHLTVLATGEQHTVDNIKRPSPETGFSVVGWLSDGTRFVVNALSPNRYGPCASIWLVPALGGAATQLRADAVAGDVSPVDNSILFRTGGNGLDSEIHVMDAAGQQSRRLEGPEPTAVFRNLHWSPDGRRIAYTRLRQDVKDVLKFAQVIEVVDLNGSRPEEVLRSPGYWADFYWLPDGRIVYPLAEQQSRSVCDENLWQIEVDPRTGRRRGLPRRLTDLAGFTFTKFSASVDGRKLAFQKNSNQSDVFVARLEAAGTRLQGLRRLTLDERDDLPTAWTPDSTAVIFASNRNGPWSIFRQGLHQSQPEPLVTGLDEFPLARVSPNGGSLLYPLHAKGAKARLVRLPFAGGPPEFVTELRQWNYMCSRSPSNVCMSMEMSADTKSVVFYRLDVEGGRKHELFRIPHEPAFEYNSALSPDGARIAVVTRELRRGRIQLFSTAGRHERDINLEQWTLLGSVDFTADGKALHVSSSSSLACSLLRVDLAGHVQVLWSRIGGADERTWAIASPDGRYAAIMAWTSDRNVWIMENP